MDDDNHGEREANGAAEFDAGCAFQDAADLATRFARLGLEAAAAPLAWLPDPARDQLRHSAGDALRGLAVAPRVLSGILDELAREVEVPMEESDLGSRRRAEAGERTTGDETGGEGA
ncbi:MAG TPA: hypothetical protein VKA55_03195 [Gammaproteobacteria bacterium]|nr:hypothetical protein [Gammaproteobacteria bacterium]